MEVLIVLLLVFTVTQRKNKIKTIELKKSQEFGIFAPAGFWPRGQNPRRHPRIPRVYTYKDKEYLLKK